MKSSIGLILLLAIATTAAAGPVSEPGSMYDISAPLFDGGALDWPPWDVEIYEDDIESLFPGPVDGQVNELGQRWFSFDATVEGSDDQYVSQTNTYADDYFFAEVGTTLPATSSLSEPILFGVDSSLSDMLTSRFYTPVDNTIGQIFTRVGDSDDDGFWEVLQLDVAGNSYFAETGVSIPSPEVFSLEVAVEGSLLEVFVNGGSIFSGAVIDTTLFGGTGLSSTLTGVYFESANNAGGYGSMATYDNVRITIPEPATLIFVVLGGAIATGLVVVKRFA